MLKNFALLGFSLLIGSGVLLSTERALASEDDQAMGDSYSQSTLDSNVSDILGSTPGAAENKELSVEQDQNEDTSFSVEEDVTTPSRDTRTDESASSSQVDTQDKATSIGKSEPETIAPDETQKSNAEDIQSEEILPTAPPSSVSPQENNIAVQDDADLEDSSVESSSPDMDSNSIITQQKESLQPIKTIPGTFAPTKEETETSVIDGQKVHDVIGKSTKTKKDETPISLEASMVGAYQQSPLITAEYQVKMAQTGLSLAKREWLPTAQATLRYSRDSAKTVPTGYIVPGTAVGASTTDSKLGQIRVEQNLYNGGITLATIKASKEQLNAAMAEYLIAEKNILFKAIKSHIECYTKEQALQLNRKNEALLQESYRIAKDRNEFGEATLYDVKAMKAKLERAKGEVITAKAELQASEATYIKDTGISPTGYLIRATYPKHLMPKAKEEAISLSLQHSPELTKRDAESEEAKAQVDRTFGGLLPSLGIGATAKRTLTDTSDSRFSYSHSGTRVNDLGGDATLTIPLDFRGSTQTQVKQTKYAAARKRLEALYQRREVIEKTSQAWDSWVATKEKIEQVKAQEEAAKIAIEMAKEEYLAGTKQTLDVLSAEQEYFSAQVERLRSEQGEVLAAYALLDSMGLLRAMYLNLEVTLYDPNEDKKNNSFWGINIQKDDRINNLKIANEEMAKWETNL